jgi:hypothetical protein
MNFRLTDGLALSSIFDGHTLTRKPLHYFGVPRGVGFDVLEGAGDNLHDD